MQDDIRALVAASCRIVSKSSTTEIVGHCHDSPITIPDENDLRRLVEEFSIGLGDVEAAECRRGFGGRGNDGDDYDNRGETGL